MYSLHFVLYLAANFALPEARYICMPSCLITVKFQIFKPVLVLFADLIRNIIVSAKKLAQIKIKAWL